MYGFEQNVLKYTSEYPINNKFPDSKVHGANMGPIWGRQDPGGPHVDPMNLAIWVCIDGGNNLVSVPYMVIFVGP